jgi:hypothetical protein
MGRGSSPPSRGNMSGHTNTGTPDSVGQNPPAGATAREPQTQAPRSASSTPGLSPSGLPPITYPHGDLGWVVTNRVLRSKRWEAHWFATLGEAQYIAGVIPAKRRPVIIARVWMTLTYEK